MLGARFDPNMAAAMSNVPTGRLLGTIALYVAVFVAVFGALRWLEADRRPASLLGSAFGVLAPALLLRWLPLDRLLGVDATAALDERRFLVVVIVSVAAILLPWRWLRDRIEHGPRRDDEWEQVPSDPALGSTYRVLIVDGDCAFCLGSVRWLVARDRAKLLRVAARDSAFAQRVFDRHPPLRDVDSLIWVQALPQLGEFTAVRWMAVKAASGLLGGWIPELVRAVDRLLPLRLLDAGYAIVARLRRRLPANTSCPLPDAVERARLLP